MFESIKKMVNLKREYKKMKQRAAALSEDYCYVFGKIESYMWNNCIDSSILYVIIGILELFENGERDGLSVSEIVGDDVADFCDGILKEQGKTWIDKWREKLNSDVHKKLLDSIYRQK